jgi:ankyrin repeat protein
MKQNHSDCVQLTSPELSQDVIACIAGYCRATEKNRLMCLCKYFYAGLKNRELIVQANLEMISFVDKKREMFKYVYANNIAMIKFLLEQSNLSANCENILLMTPFDIASNNKSEEAMQLLIKHGAITQYCSPRLHAIHEATYKGDKKTIKMFLRLKINPNIATESGCTPLHVASHTGFISIVKLLIKAGACIDTLDKYGRTALLLAAQEGHTEIVEFLLDAGADINASDKSENTPLHVAIRSSFLNIVYLLLKVPNVQINYTNKECETPLTIAVKKGYIDLVHSLIMAGADVNSNSYQPTNFVTRIGNTALFEACKRGYIDIVILLLGAKAKIDLAGVSGITALHGACYYGHRDIVELLLNAKASVNCITMLGWTPLSYAVHNRRNKIIKILLKNGSRANIPLEAHSCYDPLIKKGDTAITIAEKRHATMVKLLQEHEEKFNEKTTH